MVVIRRRSISALALLVAVGAGGNACDPQPAPAPRKPSPAGIAWQRPMTGPTGLRILVAGKLIDVDAGTISPRDVWEPLFPVAGAPVFIVRSGNEKVGAVRVEPASGIGELPAAAPVVRITGSFVSLAASTDGKSLWLSEYLTEARCTLREVWLDGRAKRAARDVPCGLKPLAQTDAGLWVARDENWFTIDHNFTEFTERKKTFALLDPEKLTELAGYPEARVLGRDHFLVLDDNESNLVLHSPSGQVKLNKPSPYTEYVFNGHRPVVPVSPDGRYALFRFGSHSDSPQIIDVWVRVPGMPTLGALKYASEAWASDGRLVMVGAYELAQPIFGTWRPGDAQVAVRALNPVPKETFDQGISPIFAW